MAIALANGGNPGLVRAMSDRSPNREMAWSGWPDCAMMIAGNESPGDQLTSGLAHPSGAAIDDPTPFDLIELVGSVAGYPVGSRGTVVIQGIGQAIVDFAWDDPSRRHQGSCRQCVPNNSMKVIRKRTFGAATAGSEAATQPGPQVGAEPPG